MLNELQTNNMVFQFLNKYKNELLKNILEEKQKEEINKIKQKYFQIAKQLNSHIIDKLKDSEVDFKNQKILLMWLLLQVFKKGIVESRIEEDSDVIKDNIILYFKNKKEIGKSLEQINYSEMKTLVSKYRGKEDTSKKYHEFLTKPSYVADEYKIYKVTDLDVCLKIGKGTSWCIQGEKWAKDYLTKGPLWLITKDDKKFALFSFEEKQFMNVQDEELKAEEVKEILKNWDYGKKILEENIKNNGNLIRFLENPSEQVQLEAVKQKGWVIFYIKNPSEQVQLEVVKQNGRYIQYIDNPSENVQLEAVKQNGNAIQHIENPSEQVQLEAVKQKGWVIQYIKNPSEQVKLEAVKQDSWAIKLIENPSEQVQLEAVKQNGWVIEYINNPSEQVKLEAVKKNGCYIQYIDNPSENVQLEAMKNDGSVIRYIKNPSEQVQLEA